MKKIDVWLKTLPRKSKISGHEVISGVAVHRKFSRGESPKLWTLTSIKHGYTIVQNFKTKKEAVNFCKEKLSKYNFLGSLRSIEKNEELKKIAKEQRIKNEVNL